MLLKKILNFPFRVLVFLICYVRSLYYSLYIDEGNGKIIIRDAFVRFRIKKFQNAKIKLSDNLIINSHLGGTSRIVFTLGQNSTLEINGEFIIGNGVKLALSDNSFLSFGGRELESGSGITADSIIMCYKNIKIGKDFLCAWGVFISDSDWHTIENQVHNADILIGNHVWIANNSTILKGSIISDNSIIASQSKIINKSYPPNSLIAGIPAKVMRSNTSWNREIS